MCATANSRKQMDTLRKSIANEVRRKREEKRMSQLDLAYMMDSETSTISAIETARSNVNLLTLVRIADAMGMILRIEFEEELK